MVCHKTHTETHTDKWRELFFASLFQRIPKNLAGALHTFLVSVGIHPKGYGLIAVAQLFRYAGDVGPIGDGNTGKGVAQLVRMEARHVTPLGELLHIPGRGLRMHRLRAVLLGKDVGADSLAGLFKTEFPKQSDDFRINVDRPHLAAFRCVEVDTLLRGVTQVPGYCNRVCLAAYLLCG